MLSTPTLVIISIPLAYYLFLKNKNLTNQVVEGNKPLYMFLKNKWYFDELYNFLFVRPCKLIGIYFWKKVDIGFIDRLGPDGISSLVKNLSIKASKFQSGYIYQYAFMMLIGFTFLLTFLIIR